MFHVQLGIQTSLVDMHTDGRVNIPKAKIQIWIKKGASWPETFADTTGDVDKSDSSTRAAVEGSSGADRT
jgi:hypothetical protein